MFKIPTQFPGEEHWPPWLKRAKKPIIILSCIKKLVTLGFILTQFTGCFGGGSGSDSALTAEERWELLSQIITLEEPITTYHGFQTPKDKPKPNPEVWIEQNIARSFQPSPKHGIDVLGNGLYLSAEPTSNITFYSDANHGQKLGTLLEIPLKKNTRLLAIEDSDTSLVPIKQWLRDPEFHEKKVALLNELEIDGLLYEWPGTFRHTECSNKNWAILLLRSDRIDWQNLMVLNSEKTNDAKTEHSRSRVHRFIKKYDRGSGSLPLGIQSDDPIIDEIEYEEFLKNYVLGCRSQHRNESPEFWANVLELEAKTKSRWQEVRKQGQLENTPVERFAGILAPRFINLPDWKKALENGITHPETIYEPAPTTWNHWLKTNDFLVGRATEKPFSDLTLDELKNWNREALFQTTPENQIGVFKKFNNYGKNVFVENALSVSDIRNLKSKNLGWISLQCQEEAPRTLNLANSTLEDCQTVLKTAQNRAKKDAFWLETLKKMKQGEYQNEWYWYACWPRTESKILHESENTRHCGTVVYPEPKKIPSRLVEILKRKPKSSAILSALKMQQEVVALHPFNRGNGRVSRWLMDLLTTQNELPPIHFKNMDQDLSTGLRELVLDAIQSMQNNITLAEKCLNFDSSPECKLL